jgi:hypothetical protein
MNLRFVAGMVLLLALSSGLATAHAKHAPATTAPGRYEEWGPDIDQVEIFKSFRLADYGRLAVEPFETDGIALPDAEENTYEPVKEMIRRFTDVFVEGMRPGLTQPIGGVATQEPGVRVLRVRGRVAVLDPGSRAKRYWGGFGAGAVRVEVHCELVDAASGEVLLAFTQQRRSGFGGFGGDYEQLMVRTIRQVGEDTANVLKQF